MFDFLFKRSAKRPSAVQLTLLPVPAAIRAQQEGARQAALVRAGALEGQEAAAVEFILQCEFADARLTAAAFVNSQPLLERVYSAMRNTDRRVARLMQRKIEASLQLAKCEQRAQQCLEQARRLVTEPQLMPNQVADLDRDWSAIDVPAGQTRQTFEAVRTALHDRLACQTQLQRALIDALASLREIAGALHTAPPDVSASALDQLTLAVEQHAAAAEAPALPKHLLPIFLQEMDVARQKLAVQRQRQQVLSAHPVALAAWEAVPPATLDVPSIGLQQRVPPASLDRQQDKQEEAVVPATAIQLQELQQRFASVLDGMEKALEQGLLQAACEQDRALRTIDTKLCRPTAIQASRLAKARAELAHLMGWARWGGNVSREELLKTAEELPAQQLSLTELAKKIGSLRERWKSLDATAGGVSSRELWQRFDAACNSAYEPLAAHYRQLAEERQQNAVKAQVLLEQLRSESVAVQGAAEADWKNIAQQCQRVQQAWSWLGIIERKEKKRLDAEFAAVLGLLAEPLARQRAAAVERREQLIVEAAEIRPGDRNAPEALRALQASWQQQSLALPLERRDEQALWLRFRSACDAVFAKHKETVQAADADRLQNLQRKEALCTELEAVAEDTPAALRAILRQIQDRWARIGHVPRVAEQQLARRFDAAVAVLQQRIDAVKRTAHIKQINALQSKLNLCQAMESAMVQAALPGTDWAAEWAVLAPLAAPLERALQTRFSAALAALDTNDKAYTATLIDNRVQLGEELLRLEILLGCDSPAALSRERIRIQVEVLQSSLRAGQQMMPQEQLAALCALPAATDDQSAQRIAALLQKLKSGNN